jgi:hypothetical protein
MLAGLSGTAGRVIHRFDVGATGLGHYPSFHLERRCEFVPLLGEGFGEEGKVPHTGVKRERSIHLIETPAK